MLVQYYCWDLIDVINNKTRSFRLMQNTVRWCFDWFWYTCRRSWRNNYLDPWSNGNWCNLEGRFWYINLHLTYKYVKPALAVGWRQWSSSFVTVFSAQPHSRALFAAAVALLLSYLLILSTAILCYRNILSSSQMS